MRLSLILSSLLSICICIGLSAQDAATPKYAMIIHGGVGESKSRPQTVEARKKVLDQALQTGEKILKEGGTALDTVEAVIRILEDADVFNAGRGAVLNSKGDAELDSSIMDGKTHKCGAVAGVRTIKNPISMARLVMTETRHILLASSGADAFAEELSKKHDQIEIVPNDYFITEYQRFRIDRINRSKRQNDGTSGSKGTVGCVVLDSHGNIAAGTSTGGLTNKMYGRVGDSPIIGAGNYADNETCGVSCTGTGEDFIRNAISYQLSARMKFKGESLETAVNTVVEDKEHPIDGGIIAIDHQGNIVFGYNTPYMTRAFLDSAGKREIVVD